MNEIQEIKALVRDLQERVGRLEKQNVLSVPKNAPQMEKYSIREFLNLLNPKDAVRATLVLAYYLEKFENVKSVSVKDLNAAFERAKEKKPLNMNDKVNMNIRNGHFDEIGGQETGRKVWHVTRSGEKIIEESLKNSKINL